MKLKRPLIPKVLQPTEILFESADPLTNVLIEGATFERQQAKNLEFTESKIISSNMLSVTATRLEMLDVLIERCSLTASSFANSSWHYSAVTQSRCSGLQLQHSLFKNCTFSNTKLSMVNFRVATLENVVFSDCIIEDIDFYNAKLKNVRFENCTIETIELSGSQLKNVDLSSSKISNIKGLSGLKGATMSQEQLVYLAPYFANEIGIIVSD